MCTITTTYDKDRSMDRTIETREWKVNVNCIRWWYSSLADSEPRSRRRLTSRNIFIRNTWVISRDNPQSSWQHVALSIRCIFVTRAREIYIKILRLMTAEYLPFQYRWRPDLRAPFAQAYGAVSITYVGQNNAHLYQIRNYYYYVSFAVFNTE